MPKWKKGETDFTVRISVDNNGGFVCRLPKPMVEHLGLNGQARFRILKTRVEVSKP